MLHNRSLTHNRSAVLLTALAGVILLMGAAYTLGRATVPVPSRQAVVIEQPAPNTGINNQQALNAYAARMAGLAGMYTTNALPANTAAMSQQALEAYAARWTTLAEAYGAGYDAHRTMEAYAARLTGQSQLYAEPKSVMASTSESQEANTALAAHYTGLAIQEYVRTGNPKLLPQCLTPEIFAALPSIGDNSWRSEIATCGQ